MTLRQSASIHVCALRHVAEMVKHTGARHLVSAINADFLPETPTAIPGNRHLKLDMNDIVEAQPDLVLPNTGHVAKLLDFVRSWDKQSADLDPLLRGAQPLDGCRIHRAVRLESSQP